MFCKWCGVANDDDAVFCTGCGRTVADRTNPIASPVSGVGQTVPVPPSSEPFAASKSVEVGSSPAGGRSTTISILVVVAVALGLALGGVLLSRTRNDPDSRTGEAGELGGVDSQAPDSVVDAPTSDVDSQAQVPGEPPGEAPVEVPPGDGVLRLGGLVPETGNLAFLGPPIQAGIDVAVADVNAAGGVGGVPVEFIAGDSGDNGDVANATVDRLIGAGVDGFIGPASSSVSLTVIDKITQAGRVMVSPSNTSVAFTNYADNGLYFRTSPSDELQGAALGDLVVGDGHTTVVLLMLDDGYATTLGDFFARRFEANGGSVLSSQIYESGSDLSDPQLALLSDAVLQNNPDAVVLIGFDETARILDTLVTAGDGPQVRGFYGTDGNMGDYLGSQVQSPAALNGMRGTLPGVDVAGNLPDFAARLSAAVGGLDDYSYSAESYDAVIITALASVAAGTDDAVGFGPRMVDVTRSGQVCTSFPECRDLLLAGVDIDYEGLSGSIEMSDVGEPTVASVLTLEFDGTGRVFVVGSPVTAI